MAQVILPRRGRADVAVNTDHVSQVEPIDEFARIKLYPETYHDIALSFTEVVRRLNGEET